MGRITLFDGVYPNGIKSVVTAKMISGCLTIEGYDIGPKVEEVWGDSDYEYWYQFDKQQTKKLCKLLAEGQEEKDLLVLLKEQFGGMSCDRRIREYCDEHQITYKFSNYV